MERRRSESRAHLTFGGHLIKQQGTIPRPASLVNHFASRPFLECQKPDQFRLPVGLGLGEHALQVRLHGGHGQRQLVGDRFEAIAAQYA